MKRAHSLDEAWRRLARMTEERLLVRALIEDRPREVAVILYTVLVGRRGPVLGSLTYYQDLPTDPRIRVELARKDSLEGQWHQLNGTYREAWESKPWWWVNHQVVAVMRRHGGQQFRVTPESNLLMQAYSDMRRWIAHELEGKNAQPIAADTRELWLNLCLVRLRSLILELNGKLGTSGDLLKVMFD